MTVEQKITANAVKATFEIDLVVLAKSATVLRDDTVISLLMLKAVMEKRETCEAIVFTTPKPLHPEAESQ